jgi:Fic family protein
MAEKSQPLASNDAHGTHSYGNKKHPPKEAVAKKLAELHERGDSREPYTRKEISEHFDVTANPIYDRLKTLVEMGVIRKKEAHPRGIVYWVPEKQAAKIIGNG